MTTHHNAALLVVLAGARQTVLFKEDEIRSRVGVLHDLSNLKLTRTKRTDLQCRRADKPYNLGNNGPMTNKVP